MNRLGLRLLGIRVRVEAIDRVRVEAIWIGLSLLVDLGLGLRIGYGLEIGLGLRL